jgi:hypothetical protein
MTPTSCVAISSQEDPRSAPTICVMAEPQPVGWLSDVRLAGSDEPVKVVLEERRGTQLILRQTDPSEPDPPRIPMYEGDQVVVMTAISHLGFHATGEVGNNADLVHSARVVPVRREGNLVYARTLKRGEPDDGRRVHVRPGDSVTFEEGSITAELDAIDDREQATESGYAPLTSVLSAWFSFGREHWDDNAVRYVLAAARRLDMANEMFIKVREIEAEINAGDLPGPQLRRRVFLIVGCIELAVISLGRAIMMILSAPERLRVVVPIPEEITRSYPAINAIRNAYEHIEDRAFGTVHGSASPQALSIFNYDTLFREDVIVYGPHTLDLTQQVETVLIEARATLKAMVAASIPPGLGTPGAQRSTEGSS